jgi:hypothetical protein
MFLLNIGSYKSERPNIPEDCTLYSYRREHLNSYINICILELFRYDVMKIETFKQKTR